MESEKARKAADAAQGDDVCALLEKERERLRAQLDHSQEEQEKQREEVEKAAGRLAEEKERHKAIVLHLLNDRRGLIGRLAEAKTAAPPKAPLNRADSSATEERLSQLELEVVRLREDKNRMDSELRRERRRRRV